MSQEINGEKKVNKHCCIENVTLLSFGHGNNFTVTFVKMQQLLF